MKPGTSRAKGSNFELKLAADVVKASRCLKRECYRTPLSGGHPFACPADLQFSNRLRVLLPFFVEAKHHKTFKIDRVIKMTADVASWCQQVIDSAADGNALGIKGTPLLVMRGNYGNTYCAGLQRSINRFMGWNKDGKHVSRMTFYYRNKLTKRREVWTLLLWDDFLERIKTISKF